MICLDFQYKDLNIVKIKKHLLEKQNNLRYRVLFSEKYIKIKWEKKNSEPTGNIFHKTRLNISHFASEVNASWFRNV